MILPLPLRIIILAAIIKNFFKKVAHLLRNTDFLITFA